MTKNRRDLTPRRISKLGARLKPQTANIKVIVRVRPPSSKENEENHRNIIRCADSQTLTFDPVEDCSPFFFHGVQQKHRDLLKKQHKNMTFSFDRVFPQESQNSEVFEDSTKQLIDILMKGCNCSVFVYGATGAGKTFTMVGKPDNPGITVLTIQELFRRKDELLADRDFQLFVTYLEVYNETVRDLLQPGEPLQLREDAQLRVRVANLTHKKIRDADELFSLLEQGNKNRTQHPTDANAESSRSHAVFQVYLQMTIKTTGQTIVAKLSMIDLAGSERGAATGCKGMRFTEGTNINKSLLALGNCINSLADGLKHVPYRNSKLTRILKDSLGGNCHTVMIANVSPSAFSFEDTYNTLKYANRAKKIKLTLKKNVVTNEKSALEYIRIIEELTNDKKLLTDELDALKKKFAEDSKVVSDIGDNHHEARTKLIGLYETYSNFEMRREQMLSKKSLLEMRIRFKNEAHLRIADLSVRTTESEDTRKRLLTTINRMQRQVGPFDTELQELESNIQETRDCIKELIANNVSLETIADSEQLKMDHLQANHKIELMDAAQKLQCNELMSRKVQFEMACRLMKPWYLLLKSKNLVTEDMTHSFQQLRSYLLSHGNVTFEDTGDSGVSATSSDSSVSNNSEQVVDEPRTIKRKLQTNSEHSEAASAGPEVESKSIHVGEFFKDNQPSPAKRLAKSRNNAVSAHSRQRVRTLKPGTMGTAARFPNNKTTHTSTLARLPFK